MKDLWIGLSGLEINSEEVIWLNNKRVAGVILFKRNFKDKAQIKNLCREIKKINPVLQIGVDQEGGPVQRFANSEFTKLKSSEEIGFFYDQDPEKSLALAKERGSLMGKELREVGVDVSFAPVIDLSHPGSHVLKNRTYHANPTIVAELALAEIAAMQSEGLTPVVKHFPGHGGVSADTHLEEAVDVRSYEKIVLSDLEPFRICIQNNIPALMASWVRYPKVDSLPACFSEQWLKKILREKLKFKGKVFSDDMGMQAAKYFSTPEECVKKVREAGCDYVLLCNDFEVIRKLLLT